MFSIFAETSFPIKGLPKAASKEDQHQNSKTSTYNYNPTPLFSKYHSTHLVNWHMDRLFHGDVDGVGLRDGHLHVLRN